MLFVNRNHFDRLVPRKPGGSQKSSECKADRGPFAAEQTVEIDCRESHHGGQEGGGSDPSSPGEEPLNMEKEVQQGSPAAARTLARAQKPRQLISRRLPAGGTEVNNAGSDAHSEVQ